MKQLPISNPAGALPMDLKPFNINLQAKEKKMKAVQMIQINIQTG